MSAMSHASRAAHASVDLDHVESLLAGLQKQVAAFRKGNAHARLVAATAAHHLATALESPGEWLVRSTWVEVRLSLRCGMMTDLQQGRNHPSGVLNAQLTGEPGLAEPSGCCSSGYRCEAVGGSLCGRRYWQKYLAAGTGV